MSMLTELNAGGMSINLFEYLTTFVGNGLVFPSSIWYEDPEKRIEVSECKKGQTIYSYHYKAETDGAKKVMRRAPVNPETASNALRKTDVVSETEEQCLS